MLDRTVLPHLAVAPASADTSRARSYARPYASQDKKKKDIALRDAEKKAEAAAATKSASVLPPLGEDPDLMF